VGAPQFLVRPLPDLLRHLEHLFDLGFRPADFGGLNEGKKVPIKQAWCSASGTPNTPANKFYGVAKPRLWIAGLCQQGSAQPLDFGLDQDARLALARTRKEEV
jgi:hypothetical protein